MSRYSDQRPTSHIAAYPHHHSPDFRPQNQSHQIYQQQQLWPTVQPWSYYGPPPAVPPSLYQTSTSSYSQYVASAQPQPAWQVSSEVEEKKRSSKGRDYLRDLGSDLASMTLYDGVKKGEGSDGRPRPSSEAEKPLPRIPVPPVLQHRPNTEPVPHHHPQPVQNAVAGPSSPPKSFRPSPYLILPSLHVRRPTSDPTLAATFRHSAPPPSTTNFPSTPPRQSQSRQIIDLTYSPSSSSSTATPPPNITPRSPARLRKRATSEQPPSPPAAPFTRPQGQRASTRSPAPKETGAAVRCAGYTRAGQPCKRLVKASAPLLSSLDINILDSGRSGAAAGAGKGAAAGSEEVAGRYCKDHAGMICSAGGFYPRDNPGVWVAFDDWIPPELGQQTQTLLRMTMESILTAKESPGFIYAYELRDLQTPRTSYYKVGRTDNVPRRIGQWTNQCTSKSPTLRDIFPLPPSHTPATHTHLTPRRRATLTRSFLPGAVASGTISSGTGRVPSKAMKRWERLIHLELAEVAARERPEEWESEELKGKCGDCGVVHKEVFPVARTSADGGGEGSYQVVLEIICRWERFVRFAHGEAGHR